MKKESLAPFLRSVIPEYDLMIADMENSGGWLVLNDNIIENSIRLKLEWWKAYEDEKLLKTYQLLMFFDLEELKQIKTEQEALHAREELESFMLEFAESKDFKECRPLTDEETAEIKQYIERVLADSTKEEQVEFWRDISFQLLGLYSSFFDLLALMIHGKSMRQLVFEAKENNDKSFVLAVQTDRMVLSLPYFQQRMLKAQLRGERQFLDELGYRMKNPVIKGKIRRRTLWLVFALLENEGLLDMPLNELLYICTEAGIYGDTYGIGDENSLGKRRREYKLNKGTRKYF